MSDFIWPVPLYRENGLDRVSGEWGPRVAPVPGASTFHRGIDLGWCAGYDYVCSAAGEVIWVGSNGGEGFSVHVRHDEGTITKYFHSVAGSAVVSIGDRVSQGQKLAVVGNTGVSGGPHLHWEVWVGGTQNVNPRDFMAQFAIASLTTTPFQEDELSADAEGKIDWIAKHLGYGNGLPFDTLDIIRSNQSPQFRVWRSSQQPGYESYGKLGTGEIRISAPGSWIPVPNEDYFRLLAHLKVVPQEIIEVQWNVFDYLAQVFTGDDAAIRAALEQLPAEIVRQIIATNTPPKHLA